MLPHEEPGRLKLLASAIAGRTVDVAAAESGARSWTDGATVFIDTGTTPADQLHSLIVQSSLLAARSLDREIATRLAHRPALTRRYLFIEGHRALAAQEALLPLATRSLIDQGAAARTRSPAESLALASTRADVDVAPAIFGEIRPKRLGRRAQRPAQTDTPHPHAPRRPGTAELRQLSEGDDDFPTVDLSSPVGGGGAVGRLLKRVFGAQRSSESGAGPAGADSPTHWSGGASRAARSVAISTAPAPVTGETAKPAPHGITYPEWDERRRQYRPRWCTVFERDPEPTELAPFMSPNADPFRPPLARLGMELQRQRRQLQGDEVDVDAAVEAWCVRAAGSVPDEAVYIDTLRQRRDLSVLLLLDISGSAGEPSASGVAVHEHQRAAAAALLVTLHGLGDRVALYGFRSQGRSAVQVVRAKRFGENLDAVVLRRLGGFVPGGYTRLGAAIRHGAAVLEREAGTPRRLLVVISDGFAYDHGYERAYGEADARRALAEVRRSGIGSLCLSIGADTDVAALRRVFGTAAHASIPQVEQLPWAVGPLFRSALRSADHQRTQAQRRERTRKRLVLEKMTA
jgi:Mg-chelatase subunit ChlD